MKKTEWKKLIRQNIDQIKEAGIKAYKEAWENSEVRTIVEIDSNGEVNSWYDLTRKDAFHAFADSELKIMQLMQFYFQDYEIVAEELKKYDKKIPTYVFEEHVLEVIEQKIEEVIRMLEITDILENLRTNQE